jgi:hypothetical protein
MHYLFKKPCLAIAILPTSSNWTGTSGTKSYGIFTEDLDAKTTPAAPIKP